MARKRGGRHQPQSKPDSKEGGPKLKKPPLTHFVCLPLVNESSQSQLQNALARFAQDESGVGSVFHERALRPVGALHFTVGVMSLMDKERLNGAIQKLQSLNVHEILRNVEQNTSQEAKPAGLSGAAKINAVGHAEQLDLSLESPKNAKDSAATNFTREMSSEPGKSKPDPKISNSEAKTRWTVEPLSSPPLSSLMRPVSPPPWPRPASETTSLPARRLVVLGSPLNVKLSALHAMQSPSKTSILFASAEDPSSRLLPFASALRTSFTDAGFLVPDDRPLKLHATIVNTIYAKAGHPRAKSRRAEKSKQAAHQDDHDEAQLAKHDPENESDEASKKDEADRNSEDGEHEDEDEAEADENTTKADDRQPSGETLQEPPQEPKFKQRFNATALIQKYKDFVWAENVRLDRLAICEMGAKKVYDESGKLVEEKYTEIASIPLP